MSGYLVTWLMSGYLLWLEGEYGLMSRVRVRGFRCHSYNAKCLLPVLGGSLHPILQVL